LEAQGSSNGQVWLELGFLLEFSCWLRSYDECWAVLTNRVSSWAENSWFNLGENGHLQELLRVSFGPNFDILDSYGMDNQVQYSPSQDLRELVEKEGINLDKCKFELKTFQIIRGLTYH